MRIEINDPCHEDWSKMSPEEQGRFCQSCQKTVVDFREKSRSDIEAFLKTKQAEGQKTCGRFNRHQLDMPAAVQERNVRSFNRRWLSYFAAACMLAFGSALFSGCADVRGDTMDQQQIDSFSKGDQSGQVDTAETQTLIGDTTFMMGQGVVFEDSLDEAATVKGELPYIIFEPEPIPRDTFVIEEIEMMGDIAIEEEIQGNIAPIKVIEEIPKEQKDTFYKVPEYPPLMGVIRMREE